VARKKPTHKKIKYEKLVVVRNEDGSTKQTTEEHTAVVPREPDFVKMYIDDVSKLCALPKAANSVLHKILERIDYENIITLSPRIRKNIAKSIDITERTFNNKLNELVKKDLLKPLGWNEYAVNPSYFARGEWTDIYKYKIKYASLRIEYDARGNRTIVSDIKINEDDPFEV